MKKTIKNPKIISIHKNTYAWMSDPDEQDPAPSCSVRITLAAMRSLPSWVQSHLHWEYILDNKSHCALIIQAKDELEAMIRFKQLWAGLPKRGA
jgi:hypothetical protein